MFVKVIALLNLA